MRTTNFGKRKIIASLLCANMFLMNTPLGVLASTITGFEQTSGTYNIEALKHSGSTGFRNYTDFKLSQGDIANLIFKDGQQHFVNLVANKVDINGIVNTMQNSNFYNGHAIFISPNGIAIGASGVLNVGSLSLLTPSSDKFNALKSAYEAGTLTGYQYDAENYKALIKDSHGNVVINGKIISRGDVNIYGSSITVKGTAADKAGIIAGVQGQDVVFNDEAAAKSVFDTLVSNNITDTTNFALSDGKIKIVADSEKTATIEIENANIAAKEVDMQAIAKSTKKVNAEAIEAYNSSQNNNNNNNNNNNEQTDTTTGKKIPDSFKGVADKATATITIKDSNISADKVSITSNATNETETYIQLISPIWENWINLLGGDLLLRILAKMDDEIVLPDGIPYSSVEAVKNYFSDKAYQNLDGAVASGTISIEASNIIAKDSINIDANSEATTKISTGVLDSHPLFFYGLGAKAESNVSITGSTLKTAAAGTVDINAHTETSDTIKYDSSNFLSISEKPQETGSNNNNDNNNNNNSQQQSTVSAYNLTLLNNSIISSANVEISGSTIETNDLNVSAIDFNTSEIELKNVSYNGEGADKTGIAAAFLINHTDTNANIEIKENSTVKASNDVSLIAQNINWFDNYVETEVEAKNQTYTVKNKVDTTFSPSYTIKAYEWLNKKFLDKATNKVGDVLDKLHLEISGSAIWNNEHNASTAAIDGSTVNAKNVSVESNMVDLVANGAEAYATSGNKFSAGMALVVNDQNNTNNAKIINGAKVTAESGVDVSATTQLPMNPMELKIGQKLSNGNVDPDKKLNLFLGASFDQSPDSITGWDVDFLHTKLKDIFSKDGISLIKSGIGNNPTKFVRNNKISLDGLFNNYAKAEGTGETVGIAGSVVANSVTTNTNAFIDGAKVIVTDGDINVNAANSVVNYNGAGKVDFLIEEINGFIKGGSASDEIKSKFGIGGSVLVENFTNNANAYINNSTAKAEEGDINVNSATEEAYVNFIITGGKASTLAVDGSVDVQRINGKTQAYITNSKDTNEIVADNVNVNAGKAKIKPKKSGTGDGADPIELDEDTNQLSVADEREVKDSVLNVSILGTNAQTEGSGVSVGASVDVENSRRETVAYISNSTVTATKNASVIASNNAKKIDVLLAGAFAGGVSTNRTTQENANSNPTTEDDSTPQRMQNAGNWMDEIDNAPDDAQDVMNLNNLFNDNDPNTEGANNATQNRDNIANQDNIVNNDGETQNGATSNNSANNPGNNNGSMADGTSNPSNSSKNFSLALAGAVSVFNDNSVVKSEIINSTINVGEKLNTTATRDNFVLNISGGLAKAGNIGGGAGVNVHRDKGTASAKIDAATIIFTSSQAKALNVLANNTRNIVNVAVGVGIAKGENSSFKTAIGGSFNTNILKDTTSAFIKNNTTVKNDENVSGDIDTKVEAKANTKAWDVGGDLAYTSSGNNDKFSMGAAIAGNMDLLEQTVKAEISGSTLENIKALTINSELVQDMNTIGVAGAITTGSSSKFSFNIDGALALEMLKNNVTSLLKDSTVTASGDVKVDAKSDIKGQALTGGVEFSNTQNGLGVGIGSVITIDDSTISAKADGATIKQSNSIEVKADSKDDRKFLAVNLGIQNGTGTSVTITANGIVEVLKSTVDAAVLGESDLKSNGAININSIYNNSNQGIAVVANKSKDGLAVGANVMASYYGNKITSEIAKESKISQAGSVRVDANTSELLNYIPVTVGIATGNGNGVGANVIVNLIKNETSAKVYGDITTAGKFVVEAMDETQIKERGGVLAYSQGNVGIAASVYYDYMNKKVTAEVKDNTVSSGAMTVQATSVNSLGGTKKDDGSWDVSEMSKKASDYGQGFTQNSSFGNWNMAYSLAHGDSIGGSGAVMVRVLDNVIKANVEGVNLGKEDAKSGSLTIYANDYTIMNMIAGEFSASGKVAIGANSIIVLGKTDVQSLLTGGKQYLTGDLSVTANVEKLAHTVIVGGGGAGKVAINGSVYLNKVNDNILSSIIASEIVANKVDVYALQKNDSLGVDLSVAASGTASIGGIVYLNLFEDTTKALVGDNSKNRTKIETTEDVTVKADSDYESREYLLSVAASGTASVSGLGIANVMDSTIESGVYNADVTSTAGKIDVEADRGFNRIAGDGKTAFFRNWFKDTNAYKNQGVSGDKDNAQRSEITKNDLDGIAPIVGAISVAASGTAGVSGSIIVNKTRGSLTAKIDNSTVNSVNGTTVKAKQDFVNFDAIAAVAASATVSLNGVGVINNLSETITAQINDTESKGGLITTNAQSNMNLNQLVISGQGAGAGAAIGVVVDKNDIDDKVYSYITGGTKTSYGAVANSAHNIMINNILLAGTGAGTGAAIQAIPIINNFTGETISKIDGATINGGNIRLSSFDNLDNLSAVVGVAVSGTGANLSGYAIRNKLDNKSKAYISNSTINTTGAININADSVVNSTNALFSAGIAGMGLSGIANVISNTITSEVEGYIKDSTITQAGDIKIIANVNEDTNKYRYDQMTNTTGNVSFAAQGAALATNVIYTNYSNKVKTYIENSASTQIGDITLDANSERRLDNINVGIGAAAIGAAVGVNAISTNIDTSTLSYIDAKTKTMDNVGDIKINSRDDSDIKNTMGTIQAAGLGAAAGVGLDMTWNNNITKSEILSGTAGQINAASASLKSDSLLEYDKSNVGVSLGAVGLAGDYVLIKSGKRANDLTQSEKDSKIEDVINKIDSQYVPKTPIAAGTKTGSITDINGNLTTSGNISVSAESKMKGRGNDNELNLSNVTVTVGIGAGSVGVRDVDLASNTNAGIIGGTVKTTNGDISVDAKNTSNVKIKNVNVSVSGVNFSGGSALYHNTSNTAAQIGSENYNTDVTSGGNINVNTESTSNSEINATYVTVTGAGLVAVDLVENVDTNNAAALVSGGTNITATNGTLSLHSTVNTDLQSTKKTYRFSGVDLVNVSKNEVTVNTINRALIQNVNGTINTKNIDIITDYGKMSALTYTNFVSATIAGAATVASSGSFMNAAFTSGINSPSGLVLNNTGTTNIITAQEKNNGTSGLVSKGKINNVDVGGIKFAAVSSANAQNRASSNTVLTSNDFTTGTLNVNSNLRTSAVADANAKKIDLAVGVNAVKATSKDESTMNLTVSGKNKVIGNAVINGTHIANTSADLSDFGFSLLARGSSTTISTELIAATNANIGGKFDASSMKIDLNTTRESYVSKSSGGGGIISVSNPDITNKLTGNSILNIKDLITDKENGLNDWDIKNTSTNIFDVVASDVSGGFISVNTAGMHTTFNTSSEINIDSTNPGSDSATNINSDSNVKLAVKNTAIVNESTTTEGGGFVAVATNNVNNSYTSNAKLTIANSKINAKKDIELKAESDIHTKTDDYVDYVGGAGGFVAVDNLNITNTLTQTNNIDIKNSTLTAEQALIVNEITHSKFRQRIESKGKGFVSVPRGYNYLYVNNTNTLSLDNKSELLGGDKVVVNLDSNDTLEVRTRSDARNFAGKPSAYSYLYNTITNTINNNGTIEAGNLVAINYMNGSVYNLDQHAYSECHASIAASNEGGVLSRAINNNLNVNQDAKIKSGKDVEINYKGGSGSSKSYIAYKNVSYMLFGIPITKSGETYNYNLPRTNKLNLEGDIIAGQGNSRYMMINRNGDIDMSTLAGFYPDDYTITEQTVVSGETIKARSLASIKIELDNVNESITKISNENISIGETLLDLTNKENVLTAIKNELKTLIDGGAILIDSTADSEGNSAFFTIINDDVKSMIIGSADNNKITQEQYDKISVDYTVTLNDIYVYNYGHENDVKSTPTIVEFMSKDTYGLTESQINNIATNYGTVDGTDYIVSPANRITAAQYNTISLDFENAKSKDNTLTINSFLNTNKATYGITDAQISNISANYGTENAGRNIICEANQITQANYDAISSGYQAAKAGNPNLTISEFLNKYDLSDAQINNIRANYGKDDAQASIVGDGNGQITQEKYDTISNAYQTKVNEINIWNKGHPESERKPEPTISEFLHSKQNPSDAVYNLSDAQITTVADGFDTVLGANGNLSVSELGLFVKYKKGSDTYVAVTTPSGTGTAQTCKELTNLQSQIDEIKNMAKPYTEKQQANTENLAVLNANRIVLQKQYDDVYNTDASEYEQRQGGYSIIFNDIYPKDSHILVDGADNRSIIGSGKFSVATNGLKIDNYSTRTLVFNDLMIDRATSKSGLFINGKDHALFAGDGTNQAVSGLEVFNYLYGVAGHKTFENLTKSGVHYVNGGNNISGITINSYYDINHPFASEFDIPNPTKRPDVYITGDIFTKNDFNLWTESGHVLLVNSSTDTKSSSILAPNGIIAYVPVDDDDNPTNPAPINIKSNDSMFAGSGISISVATGDDGDIERDININGKIESGYTDRRITITSDMIKPENLINDPTSGEQNMINLGLDSGNKSFYQNTTNGNIKAIYENGQIYLYNLADDVNANTNMVTIEGKNISVSDSGSITLANGLKNITINNETNAQLNVANIDNKQNSGFVNWKTDSGQQTISASDTTKNITINTIDHANTQITSNGKLSLNGVINNNIISNYDDYHRESGILNIAANNGLDIKQKTKLVNSVSEIIDSINSYGNTTITVNGGQGDINGQIKTYGALNVANNGSGNLNIKGDIINDAVKVYSDTESADVSILSGSVNISNTDNGILNIAGDIEEREGNVAVNSNAQTNITGGIYNDNGNISVTSKGLSLKKLNEDSFEAALQTLKGDITITNTENVLDLAGIIATDAGNILITNNSTNGAEISGTVSDKEGDITVSNTAGTLNLTNNGKITDDKGTISISNTATDKGTTLAGQVAAKDGNITVGNAGDKLALSGSITDEKGNVSITNSGANGTEISGTVSDKEGDITVSNTAGTLNLTNNGKITDDKGAISISNTATDKGTTLAGQVTAKDGNITVGNAGDKLALSGSLTDEKGNVSITNSGASGAEISGTVFDKEGDITVSNTAGTLNLTNNGKITDDKGAISISNTATDKGTTLAGQVTAKDGNITVGNAGDKLALSGSLTDEKGNVSITNSGANGAEISGTVSDKEGDITISNTAGTLNLTNNGKITDDKGTISISNTATDKGTTLAGQVTAKDGNITVGNAGDKLSLSGSLTDEKGNVSITNSGANGAEISGTVSDKEGDITVSNTAGKLNLTNNGKITDDKGAISISNTATDKGTTLAGQVTAKDGNITVGNAGDKLALSGSLTDEKGNVSITNSGANGAEISGTVSDKEGDITVSNTAGTLNLTNNGKITDDKGAISISNTATDKGTTLAGQVTAKDGNITVGNAGDKLTVSGSIAEDKGDISITNDGNNGTEFTSTSRVTNANGDTTITNNEGDLTVADGAEIKNTGSGDITVENNGEKFTISGIIMRIGDAIGNIFVNNTGDDELEIASTGKVENSKGDIDVQNSNAGELNIAGLVQDNDGNVSVKNDDDGGINISGTVASDKGTTTVENTSDDGILITTTGKIHNGDGDISVTNTGADGIDIQGSIKADNQNITITNEDSDITIGEYASDNDNYIQAVAGNITINQTGGDILNNITDPDTSAKHQNYDLANPNHSYKTLIAAGNDLTIDVKDGDIGITTHANPGLSIDAGTRDYTESINVNVGGSVIAKAINENDTDKRLINIRAKDSDLTLKDVTSDGNVILTSADWRQADTRPTPDDEAYFKGYSILSSATGNTPAVTGQNISIISSDNIGTSDKKLVYMQDTLNAPNSSVSFESENDINVTAKANSANETKIYQMISKHGTIDLDLEADGVIKEITSGKGLDITQKAQNLTIIDLGLPVSSQGSSSSFDDMLNPHDDLVYGIAPDSSSKSVVPNYINIKALDAINNPERGDSNLKIYNAYVKGNQGENTKYYPNGTRLADVTLMADNIYANSAKAPDSTVSTVANPDGFKQPDTTYTLADFGFGDEDNISQNSGQSVDTHAVLEAHGINAYGEGEPLSLDILGVDKDIVDDLVTNPNRNLYEDQQSVTTTPDKFKNPNDEIVYYNTDYRAKNAVISVNDYVDTNRGVVFDTLYADNSYVNTKDTNLDVTNGYITNYAEMRNNDKIAVVDNDFRRIVRPANIQLYTQKTGSFALGLNDTINMSTTAPTVYNNPYMLVNGYHSAWNFVNREFKENKDLIDNTRMTVNLDRFNYDEPQKRISERFDTTTDTGLVSDFEILDISTTGASVKNDKKLKRGKNTKITIKFDDVDITLNAKVVKVEGNTAGLEFIDIPQDVANKILYRYMQRANSMKSNLTTSL